MFSVFECFINSSLNSDDEEKRLVEKKNELFKSKFPILNINEINSSVDMKKNVMILHMVVKKSL